MRLLLLGCVCATSLSSSPAFSQTPFDGFRIGAEYMHAATRTRVDVRHPRDAMIADGRARLAQGEAALANGEAMLAARRLTYREEETTLVTAQRRLDIIKADPAPSSPTLVAARAATIAQMQNNISNASASLTQQANRIEEASRLIDYERTQLQNGRSRLDLLSAMPDVISNTMNGSTVRFSGGWGTSFQAGFGTLYLGGELDAAPGYGRTTIRLPEQNDTNVKAGASFGATVRAGWVIVPWAMPYVAAGGEAINWSVARGTKSRSEWMGGARVGVGVEFSIADQTLLRVGYDHTFVPDMNFSHARIRSDVDIFRIGLIRTF